MKTQVTEQLTQAGQQIEHESFAVVDHEASAHSYSAEQWPIVRRMIHAPNPPTNRLSSSVLSARPERHLQQSPRFSRDSFKTGERGPLGAELATRRRGKRGRRP